MIRLSVLAFAPLLIALLGFIPRANRHLPRLAAALLIAQIPAAYWACRPAFFGGADPLVSDFLIDGTGAAFAVLTTLVAAFAMFHAVYLFPADRSAEGDHSFSDRKLSLFYAFSGLFLLSMYAVLFAHNIGYLWIAMEATTLMSAPLVYFHGSKNSLEATWKYLILCSVGIAFALLGTVLIFAASQRSVHGGGTMMLGELMQRGHELDPHLLRLGFIFCLLGYGTKAGLFPLHNWLPDAHSEAPAPASAMLSGSLLNCALVAIWRISQIARSAGQDALVSGALVPMAALTTVAAGIMLIRQHDLKRMWAYSSVEHAGLLGFAIGLGSGPLFLLHAINHSIVKAALFLLSGNLQSLYGTKSLNKIGGALRAAPAWGALLAAGSFAIAGSPPFGTFLSEWLLLSRSIKQGKTVAAISVMIGLTLAFVAILSHLCRVLFGSAPRLKANPPSFAWSLAPGILLAGSLLTGLALRQGAWAALNAWMQGSVLR